MKISFSNNKLQKIFADERKIDRTYGRLAKKVKLRYRMLDMAASLSDVPTGPPENRHIHVGDRKGQYSVWLSENMRLFFIPDHDPMPLLEDGGIDTKSVTEIVILGVEDPH